ncbi:BTB/POZ domain-containing protein KCTD5 [Hydra vulgaris]|uniref:BTB/POZ domain-containing protein KCTD5 n=2 Tax=Hydra vulgaris TaxID=6087 RepID=A0ABM4CD13_HYDVU|nr:BTB/POZ domain-containing protein KCTD5 [Hydra vulgaris]
MATNGCTSKSWVKLNVGGKVFLTTKTTLLKEPDCFLGRLATEDPDLPSDKDENGAYMIDRDPKYFSPILNYLRHGKVIIDDGLSIEGVLEEACFYSIKSLISILKDTINTKPSKGNRRHIYRVLQCQEEELAHTISNMSDGWKFEQLLNIGSNYNYGPDEQGEYLYIVSKDVLDSQVSDELQPVNLHPKVFQLRGT